MRYGLLVVAIGVVLLQVGVYLAWGLPAPLILAGSLFVAAGLLINLESE